MQADKTQITRLLKTARGQIQWDIKDGGGRPVLYGYLQSAHGDRGRHTKDE